MTTAVEPFALRGTLRERARSTALSIGERLLEEMERPDALDPNYERYPNKHLNGTVGFALAFLALATASGDARFERAMHAQLKRAAEAPGNEAGLFDGISGLRAVAALATEIEPRYRSFVARCDSFVESALAAQPLRPARYGDYDVISGWSGMRLARCVGEEPAGDDRLAAFLEWLIEDDERWACPYVPHPGGPVRHWLGMAHGIAGVLATLAIASPRIAPQLHERVSRAARFVAGSVREVEGYYAWPRAAEDEADAPCRAVWCVGAAGIAAALLQVAQRAGDGGIETFARGVLTQLSRQPSETMRFGGQGICHGTVGNAVVFFVAARRTGDPVFAYACERFVLETIEGLDATGGRCMAIGNDGVPYDALGELNGVAGIAIALLTMASGFDPGWLRCHALAVD